MRKFQLSVLAIIVFSVLTLCLLPTTPANAQPTEAQPVTLLTFTTPFTSYLPVIVSPPVPPTVSVVSSSTYRGCSYLYIVGEVVNNTPGNVKNVKITGTLHNSNGDVLSSSYSYAYVEVLAPGQKTPFRVSFYDPPAEYMGYQLSVSYKSTTEPAKEGLSILSINTWDSESGDLYMVGEVQNNTGDNIEDAEIIATYYDATGVVNVNHTLTGVDILSPGQKGCFGMYMPAQNYNSYTLVTDYLITTKSLPSLEILSVTPSGDLHLAGQIRNNHPTETYNLVKAVATLYDSAGKVINCNHGYTSPWELAPGDVAPYDIDFYYTTDWANYAVVASAKKPN